MWSSKAYGVIPMCTGVRTATLGFLEIIRPHSKGSQNHLEVLRITQKHRILGPNPKRFRRSGVDPRMSIFMKFSGDANDVDPRTSREEPMPSRNIHFPQPGFQRPGGASGAGTEPATSLTSGAGAPSGGHRRRRSSCGLSPRSPVRGGSVVYCPRSPQSFLAVVLGPDHTPRSLRT